MDEQSETRRSQSTDKDATGNEQHIDEYNEDTMRNMYNSSDRRYSSDQDGNEGGGDDEDYNFIDEKEKVQKKVFTNWINSHVPNCIQSDIIEELRDGTKLIALIHALSGVKLNEERGRRLRRIHFISNVNKVLDFCADRGIRLVNIFAPEIVDGNPRIILGLIWHLILRFHIEEYIRLSSIENLGNKHPLRTDSPYLKSEPEPQTARSVRQHLLDNLNRQFPLNATDFGPFWRDGNAFLTLIDAIHPQLKAREKGRAVLTNRPRLHLAFDLAEKELGIKRLLDPEDIDVDRPDERSIMTYVSQFLNRPRISSPIEEPLVTKEEHFVVEAVEQFVEQPKYTTDVITKWVEYVLNAGITQLNIEPIESEFNQLRDDFERYKHSLEPKTVNDWYLIKRELPIGKQLNDWIDFANQTLQSYKVPLSGEEVNEQLRQHRLKFATIPKFENTSFLLDPIIREYNNCIKLIEEWEKAMCEASKRWAKYDASKEALINWIVKGEELLDKAHDPNREDARNDLQALKEYFADPPKNEAILFQFIADCDDVFETLPEEHQQTLREVLKNLEIRFRDITSHRAPIHLIKFEFNLMETDLEKKLNDDKANEAMILDDLCKMEQLANSLWQKFNDNSLLDRVNEHRRRLENKKMAELPKHEINLVRRDTMSMIYETLTQIESITIRSRIEILKDNDAQIRNIKLRTQVLRSMSMDAGVDMKEELAEIESHITKLDGMLVEKKKEVVNHWLQEEAPLRLMSAQSTTDIQSLKEETVQYKELVSETELVKKVHEFDAQTKLTEIEKCRVDSIPEAEDKIEELKQLPMESKEIRERIVYLETKVLEEWKAIVDAKGVLQDWLRNKSLNADVDKIRAKEAEVVKLIDRFNRSEPMLRTFASDLAMNELRHELNLMQNNYRQEMNDLIRFKENMKTKQEVNEFLNSVEIWLNNNPLEQIIPEYVSTVDEALPIINNKQIECQKLKDELQMRFANMDEELRPRATQLMTKLNAYDWNAFTSYHISKFQALKQSEEELERLRDQLRLMGQLIDNLESKLSGITAATDSLPKKRMQKEVSEDLLKQIESIKVADIMRHEALEDDYKSVMERFQELQRKLVSIVEDKRKAYDDYAKFSDLCDKFIAWMKTLRDIIPPLPENTANFDIFLTSLSNLLSQKAIGDYKLSEIKNQGSVAAETSSDSGKEIINNTVDALQRDYNSLFNEINKIYEDSKRLESSNQQMKLNYQQMIQWLYDVKSEIKMLPLQKTLTKKENQLKELESLQQTLKEKEADIHHYKQFEQQSKRNSSDIESLYSEVLVAVQFQISRWKNYVSHHSDFDASLNAAKEVNNRVVIKVKEIEGIDDPEEQCRFIDDILSNENDEIIFRKMEDQLRVVTTETASEGADILSKIVKQTKEQREYLKLQLMNLKKTICEVLSKKQKYDNLLERINATLDSIEKESDLIVYPCGSIYDKELSLQKAKTLKYKCESIGIYEFPVIPEVKPIFDLLLQRYETIKLKLDNQIKLCELAYNHHSDYNDHKTKFDEWITEMKRTIPTLRTSDYTDLSSLQKCMQIHEKLKRRKSEGNDLLNTLQSKGEIVIELSDDNYSQTIHNDYKEYELKLNNLFSDIDKNMLFLKNSIEVIDGKSDLWQKLRDIEEWIKNNPKEELLPERCFTSISEALDAMELKKIEWQTQRDILSNIYEALKTGEYEEDLINKYTEVCKQIESYDWDTLIRKFSERVKQLIQFIEDTDNLRNAVKQINALIDIIYNGYEILDILSPTDTLENKKLQLEFVEAILKYVNSLNLEGIPKEEVIEDDNETIRSKLEKFKDRLKRLTKDKQKAYNDHFMFQKACSSFIAWLRALKAKIPSAPSDGTNIESHIADLTDLETQKPIAEKKLKDVKDLCSFVLQNTSENGKKVINATMESLEKAYRLIFDEMTENIESAKNFKYETLRVRAKLYQRLSDWLVSLENEIKELPLRGTLTEKEEQLSKLKLLEEELLAKEASIQKAIEKGRKENNEEAMNHLNDIDQRYKQIVISIRAQIEKWSTFVKNHSAVTDAIIALNINSEQIENKMKEIASMNDHFLRSKAMKEIKCDEDYDTLVSNANTALNKIRDETTAQGMDILNKQLLEAKNRLKGLTSKLVSSKDTIKPEIVVPEKHEITFSDESDFENRSRGSSVASDRSTSGKKKKSHKLNPLRIFKS